MYLSLFQYEGGGSSGAGTAVFGLLYMAAIVFYVVCQWKIFSKAGREGWEALVPIYSNYVELKIVGRPGWWIFLFLVPLVNLVVFFIVNIDLAKSFGKSTGYGIALTLLSPIFVPMLAFGDARYQGPAAADGAGRSPARGTRPAR